LSTLYIANCTRQYQDFHFRVPAEDLALTRRVQVQRISPGSQQQILGEAPRVVLEAIVDQHRPYGLTSIDDVVRTKNFVGLCYSFDRPISTDRIGYAMDHNTAVLYEEGEQRREEAAVAISDGLDQMMEEARRDGRPVTLPRAVAVENLEDSADPKYAKGFRIDRSTPPNAPPAARRAARAG
jgi:hypothetical protein